MSKQRTKSADERQGDAKARRCTVHRFFFASPLRRFVACSLLLVPLTGCSTIRGWFGMNDEPVGTKPVQADAGVPSQYSAAPVLQAPAPSSTPVAPELRPISRPVVVGRLPEDRFLVHLVDSDGPVRVANVETGEEIVTFDARAGDIVRANVRGVTLGGQPVIGAALAPGTYGIYKVLPGDAGTVQSVSGRTSVTPASQPASTTPPPGSETLDLPPPTSQPAP